MVVECLSHSQVLSPEQQGQEPVGARLGVYLDVCMCGTYGFFSSFIFQKLGAEVGLADALMKSTSKAI